MEKEQKFNQQIGSLVKTFRKKKKMSNRALGIAMGMSKILIDRIENGQKGISFYNLVKVAKILDVSIAELTPKFDIKEDEYLFSKNESINEPFQMKVSVKVRSLLTQLLEEYQNQN